MPNGLRVVFPAKMMSSRCWERSWRVFCSPSTQRIASTRLDFPEPFGPTTAVMPAVKSMTVDSANVLKPKTLSVLSRIV